MVPLRWMNVGHDPTFLERCSRNGRRQFMNLLTFGSVTGLPLAPHPVVNYSFLLVPLDQVATAKDEFGNPVTANGWLSSHPDGDRSLV